MPFDSSTPNDLARIVAYVCTDEGAAVARSVVERTGGQSGALHGGGLSGAARIGTGAPAAEIMLAEIGNIPVAMACECVTEICRSGTEVIVLGGQTDIETYRALRKAGALEYFTFPVTADDILSVQRDLPIRSERPQPAARAPSIAVLGSNGGVGASLLAQNLAFHAASARGANLRTALLDADLQFGSQAIDLDRDETVGLFEALKAPDRVDDTFLGATMDHLSDSLSLYSHQARIGQNALSCEEGLPRLLASLRAEFGAVVTDVPRGAFMRQARIGAELDAIILVVPAGFSGVSAASRLVERISSEAPDLRILPVLSNLRRDAGLSRKDSETGIGRPVVATLPRSDSALARAHRAARPLIECQPRGDYAKAVRKIWTAAMADMRGAAKPARRPLLKRMFG